ncbi:PPP4R2-domain-containing protein [Guyanagaster necrorhizus]|uniref:PPP4R2-domain-containing protein n=1 Tax=Guyanagaster necrorhizus TaxID=856835 RepID=A0A9P7W3C1_9AGAR|nr:PPP4R2-domain-containing protein [Guyanagaster necrorhizus MCA 3950]KAG7452641.1 PPP4R2-domain-containing protein [Guyanagaster necrorhizus MCA 3950]
MADLASDFQWLPEYDDVLQAIASTDVVQTEWSKLRDIIKFKIKESIDLFLSQAKPPPLPAPSPPLTLSNGGLKLPPFPVRQLNHLNPIQAPVSYMNREQAEQMKRYIYTELDEIDENSPFTIQRVCELCLNPVRHYKSVGKYLRAVEKSLLVTSTWDSFPKSSGDEIDTKMPLNVVGVPSGSSSVPATPLFSPIPFLHSDARRSKSRSPPPSPLALGAAGSIRAGQAEAPAPKALGLVDELDDPSPGHMSDHPTAISSVTSVAESNGRPFIQSLDRRFVKTEATPDAQSEDNAMVVDTEPESKDSVG